MASRKHDQEIQFALVGKSPTDAPELLAEIRGLIDQARNRVAIAVNTELTMLYWRVGNRIRQEVLHEERAEYGKRIVVTLSRQLVADYYLRLLSEIKQRIRSTQYEALKTVNKELVGLYWDIGRMIVERQVDAEHGSAIAEQLSNDLRAEFPGISGFSRRNVFYMREFYLLYRDDERVQPLVAQIGWSHNLVILQRCKMQFYLTALDRQVLQEDENPSIGIILCKEKNRTMIEQMVNEW